MAREIDKKKEAEAIKKLWEEYFSSFQKEDWHRAIISLDKLQELEPKNSNVFLKKGDIFQKDNRIHDAIKSYHQAAWLLTNDGFQQKAVAVYKIILRLNPNDMEALNKSKEILLNMESARHTALHDKAEMPPASTGFSLPKTQTESKNEDVVSSFFEPSDFGELTTDELKEESDANKANPPSPSFFETGDSAPESFDGSLPSAFKLPEEPQTKEPESAGDGLTSWESFGGATEPETKEKPDETPSESATVSSDWNIDIEHESAAAHKDESVPYMFASLDRLEYEKLMMLASAMKYKDEERVLEEGDTGDSLYIIKNGNARVVAHILGNIIELAELSTGDAFGEVAFLTGRPRTASIIAKGDLEVVELNKELIEGIIHKSPQVLDTIQDFYHTRVKETIKKVKGK